MGRCAAGLLRELTACGGLRGLCARRRRLNRSMLSDEMGGAKACRGSLREHPQHPVQLLRFVFCILGSDRVPKAAEGRFISRLGRVFHTNQIAPRVVLREGPRADWRFWEREADARPIQVSSRVTV
jgi:hypothetical protein